MKRAAIRILASLALLLSATFAQAAITCTITSPGWATTYGTTFPNANATQSSFTIVCQRGAGGDPTTLNYSVAVNNGTHAAGAQNRAQASGGARINYENYQNSTCGTLWGPNAADRITGSMTLSGFTPTTVTTPYWGCVGALQAVASGTYTDTVTMTLRNTTGGATLDTGTFGVSITVPGSCGSPAMNPINFTYIAFQTTTATASANFTVTCTNLLPYTMALDATSGVVAGLEYNLSLSNSSGTGTGGPQTYTINGTMPPLQAGNPSQSPSPQVRSLVVTY